MEKYLQKRIIRVASALEVLAGSALENARNSYNKHNDAVENIISDAIDARVQGADPKVLDKLAKKLLKAKERKEKALNRLVDHMVKQPKAKKASVKKHAEFDVKLKKFNWTQIGGDMNPGTYGAIIAKSDGNSIELRNIQPTRAYVGDSEAVEIGFPFWSTEAYYDLADLNSENAVKAVESAGISEDDFNSMNPAQRAIMIAESMFSYGAGTEEGPSGWAKDVVPGRVKWWGSKSPKGWQYLADEDKEFKQLLKEAEQN